MSLGSMRRRISLQPYNSTNSHSTKQGGSNTLFKESIKRNYKLRNIPLSEEASDKYTSCATSTKYNPQTECLKNKKQIHRRKLSRVLKENSIQEIKDEPCSKISVHRPDQGNCYRRTRSEFEPLDQRKLTRRYTAAHIMTMANGKRSSFDARNRLRSLEKSSSVLSIRKRELVLARISLYIVFVMLICNSVRLIPNTYEMVQTYSQVTFEIIFIVYIRVEFRKQYVYEVNTTIIFMIFFAIFQ
jgi:hypothetical protein